MFMFGCLRLCLVVYVWVDCLRLVDCLVVVFSLLLRDTNVSVSMGLCGGPVVNMQDNYLYKTSTLTHLSNTSLHYFEQSRDNSHSHCISTKQFILITLSFLPKRSHRSRGHSACAILHIIAIILQSFGERVCKPIPLITTWSTFTLQN